MNINHCHHIKEDGFCCQAPALRGRDYCRFHLRALGCRMRMARARARREPYHLVLPILEDSNAVQVARMQVLDALTAGLLDRKLGGLLLYGLQGASGDLRSATAAPCLTAPAGEQPQVRAEEYPGFEEEFDLPPGLDLSQPPEVVFAAEAATAASEAQATARAERSAYRSNPWQYVNQEDIELEEILITQGEEAQKKRSLELQNREWKRIEQEKRKVAQARQIMEAARRNERQWSSAKLKEHYDKLWAEAVAKEKADKEELAAEFAAARAQAAARKALESTTDGEAAASTSSVAKDAAKKVPEAALGEEQTSIAVPKTGSMDN